MSESDVKFISKSEFKKRCLPWKKFLNKAVSGGAKVIDTRDYVQKGFMTRADEEALGKREQENLKVFREKNKKMLDKLGKSSRAMAQPFDMLKRNVIGNKRFISQTLLIFDQVGKQVRWLMYNLEAAGIHDYYFLSKGANGVIGTQAYGKM